MVSEQAGPQYRKGMASSMVDAMETVTLSWNHVNVHVKPPGRMFCRGPDPKAPWKHVLREGK